MSTRQGAGWLARARQADRDGEVVAAICAFEKALAASEPFALDDYLDLVALYVEASNYGMRPHIPEDVRERTYRAALEALAKAETTFGPSAELACWRVYVGFREFGDDLPAREQLERWRAEGSELAAVLLVLEDGWRAKHCPPRSGHSTRDRLFKSLEEASRLHWSWHTGPEET